jgi:predicted GNAT family acetyltransferase
VTGATIMEAMMPTDLQVSNNAVKSRYEASVAGQVVGFAMYRTVGNQVIFVHTKVNDDFQGRGVAGGLAKWALDDVVRRGLRIVAVCPYIASYVSRHREYDAFVDERQPAPPRPSGGG